MRFFSDEQEPIHIHAFYNDCQLKVEFNIVDGIISSIIYKKIQGYDVIPEDKKKDLEKLIEIYKFEIIQLWIKFFVLHEKMTCKKISVKLK